MNHIYRSLWSESLNTWIAVSENTKGKAKSSQSSVCFALLFWSASIWALPTGEQVVAGQAQVIPTAGQMQILQTTPQAIINWQGFSIQPHESVMIQQPSFNATLLNRVIGADASLIQGQFSANGQVFLLNPNGVLFSQTAQVDVGGLIASTHALSNSDFLNGNYHFSAITASSSRVINEGIIRVPEGGIVALIGSQVNNSGTIVTPKGSTVLAAGKTVDLDFQGAGLVEVKVSEAALQAQIDNKGAILADGGQVILTAQAAGDLTNSVINHSGIIQAKSLVERNGEIILAGGDKGLTEVSGQVDTSGQSSGGKISVTGQTVTLHEKATLAAQALNSGKAGSILVFGDMQNGAVNVAGKLDASAPKTGDGGFIETSAARVSVADVAQITTKAQQGKSGTWLIDPVDITVAATGGNITGAALGAALNSSDVTLDTAGTGSCTGVTCNGLTSGNGDIFINDTVSWTQNTLTLKADRNIEINAAITGNGLVVDAAGTTTALGSINLNGFFYLNSGKWQQINPSLPAFSAKDFSVVGLSTFVRVRGGDGSTGNPYQVVDVYGLQGIGSGGMLDKNYVLKQDIDASGTSRWNFWNSGNNFIPIGDSTNPFTGNFDGLGHIVSNLTINNPSIGNVGLFGYVDKGTIRNIGIVNSSVVGGYNVGGLVGNNTGIIDKSYAIVSIFANYNFGGLVGENSGTISNSYAGGSVGNAVDGNTIGGLVGNNSGIINNTYATTTIYGENYLGGLVGYNSGNINNSYATGSVGFTRSGGSANGLIGGNSGNVTNSFWDTQTSGQTQSAGGTGKTTTEMKQLSAFSRWDISDTGGSNAVWRIYEGKTYPLLRSFLKPLIVTANDVTKPYDGSIYNQPYAAAYSGFVNGDNNNVLKGNLNFSGDSQKGINAKSYTITPVGLYSDNQQGYDISFKDGKLTISQHEIVIDNGSRLYDGTISVSPVVITFGDTTEYLILSGTVANRNTGTYKLSEPNLKNGSESINNYKPGLIDNYKFVEAIVTTKPALLTINAVTDTKKYDGTEKSKGVPEPTGLMSGDTLTNLTQSFDSPNANGENGSTLNVNNGYFLNDGNNGNNYTVITNTASGTITPAMLNAINLTGTRTYDGTNTVAANIFKLSGLVNKDDLTLSGAGSIASRNVGTYDSINLGTLALGNGKVGLASNYTLDGGKHKVTITPAQLTINGITANPKTYDGTNNATLKFDNVSYTNLQQNEQKVNDDVKVSATGSFDNKNAGINKTVTLNLGTLSGADSANYEIAQKSQTTTANITPATLTYTAKQETREYGADNPTFSGTVVGFVPNESQQNATTGNLTFTSLADKTNDVKSYEIKGSGLTANNGNYTFVQANTNATALTITKAPINLTGTRQYDGTKQVKSDMFNFGTLPNDDVLTLTGTGIVEDKNVGKNKNVTGLSLSDGDKGKASNYDLKSTTIEITKAPLTISAVSDSKVYDGTTDSKIKLTDSNVNGLQSNDKLTDLTQSFQSKDVLGENRSILKVNTDYKIVDNDDKNVILNYDIRNSKPAQGTITPFVVNLTGTRPYDGTDIVNTGILSFNETLPNQETLNFNGTAIAKDKNAGTSDFSSFPQISVNNGGSTGNYQINKSVTITPRIINLIGTREYDGTDVIKSKALTLAGLVPNEKLNLSENSYVQLQDANVPKTQSIVKGINASYSDGENGLAKNYQINTDNTEHTITITPKKINLEGTRVYDGTTEIKANVFDLKSQLVLTDTANLTGTGKISSKNANAIPYQSIDSGNFNLSNQNYTLKDGSHKVIITPALLIIGSIPDKKIYDGTTASSKTPFSFGLQTNDTLTDLSQAFTSPDVLGDGGSKLNITYRLNDGNSGNNYSIFPMYAQGTITPNFITEPLCPACPTSFTKPTEPVKNPASADSSTAAQEPIIQAKDTIIDKTDSFDSFDNSLVNTPSNLCPLDKNNGTANCDRNPIIPILNVKNQAGKVKRLQLSANKRFLSLLLEDGTIRLWDFERGVQRTIPIKNGNHLLTDISTVDEKGNFLSIASTSRIKTFDVISGSPDKKFTILKPNIRQFVSSNDGNLLLVATDSGELSLWNNPQHQQQWLNATQRGDIMDLALDKQNRYAAIVRQSKTYELSGNLHLRNLTDAVDIIELNSGKLVKSLPNTGENIVSIQFQEADTLQIALANGNILHWSVTSNQKKTVTAFAESITSVDSAGGNYVYLLHDGTLRVRGLDGQVLWSAQNAENPFQSAKLLADGKKLLTVLASGDMSLWDVESGKKILRLFSSKEGWTVMDAFGRFDGSEEAMENFSWLADEVDILLDSFSENYYEPGLLAELVSGKNALSNSLSPIQNGITLPPKINLQLAEQQQANQVTVEVDIYDRGGGINKVVQFQHNGRLVPPENQKFKQESVDHQVLTLSVIPTTGKNSLKVIASNEMGIENSSPELYFDGKTKAYEPKLRVLSVGINQYRDRNLNLKYSVADANAIAQQLVGKNAEATLTNAQASKARILAELKELSAGEQHDALVFYLAGHGHGVSVGNTKEWYFLPYESQMPEKDKIPDGAISATELADIFKQSKIQHILLLVDSCYSGASMEAFTDFEHKQRFFTRQLSRSLGITVITATAKDKVTPELANLGQLGHGLFTYQLLQELQKKTAEKAVTAHGLAKDIAKSLPLFSKQAVGISQEPAVYTHGSDFMLNKAR